MSQAESQDSALCSKGGAEVPQKATQQPKKEPVGAGPMGRADGQEGTRALLTNGRTHVPNGVLVGPYRIPRGWQAPTDTLQKGLSRRSGHANQANTLALLGKEVASMDREEAT